VRFLRTTVSERLAAGALLTMLALAAGALTLWQSL